MTLATIETLPNFGQRVTARRTASSGELEMVVDIFAGAGGASLGIEAALGRSVDKAINHNPLMIQMHEANHPATKHLPGNVWDYKPLQVTEGRPVGLLWASPDCTHFSRAKGKRPVSKKIRALAWVVTKWAREVKPRELLRAQFGRFAADYVLIGTQAQQVAGIGNSVPPELAEQLVKGNVRLQRVPRAEVA